METDVNTDDYDFDDFDVDEFDIRRSREREDFSG